jgi:hypothetical protein
MPSFGKVIRVSSRLNAYIDFSPDLKGSHRFLYGFIGKGFKNEAEAELVLDRINLRSREVGLRGAVNQFRSLKTKSDFVVEVVENFLADAPAMGSLKQGGEPCSAGTLLH